MIAALMSENRRAGIPLENGSTRQVFQPAGFRGAQMSEIG
jgi:hypothetical protein